MRRLGNRLALRRVYDLSTAVGRLELDLRNRTGTTIIGLRKSDRSYVMNPSHNEVLSSSDKLFVLGTVDQIRRLKEILSTEQ